MARIRSIKPQFYDDQKLARVSIYARYVYIGMWVHSDDYGVIIGTTPWLRSRIFPHEPVSDKQFESWLQELKQFDRIRPFIAENGDAYYFIPKFSCHQRVDKPSKHNRNPEPPENIINPPDSVSTHGGLGEPSQKISEASQNPRDKDMDRDMDRDRDIGKGRNIMSGKPDLAAQKNGIPYAEIVKALNDATGSQYKPSTKSTREKIAARWNEGFRCEDFKVVIAKQAYLWQNDPKMCAFLRPETLFGTKFEGYLNAKVIKPRNKAEERLYQNVLAAQRFIDKIEKEDTCDGKT